MGYVSYEGFTGSLPAVETWIPLLPALWALVLLLFTCARYLHQKISPHRIKLDDDARPLFAVFVTDEDILASSTALERGAALAEEALSDNPNIADVGRDSLPFVCTLVPAAEALGWLAAAVTLGVRRKGLPWDFVSAVSHALAWVYAFGVQLRRTFAIAPLALLSLYVVFLFDSVFAVIQGARNNSGDHLGSLLQLRRLPDLALISMLIVTLLQIPLSSPVPIALLAQPSPRPRSKEDDNTVLGALTYSWMSGIMRTAKARPLQPQDVWELSLNNRAEVLSRRFASLKSKTLTRKLLRASARDIGIDASLKLVASTSDYLRPFFIQKILENLTRAYISPTPDPALTPGNHDSPWTPREMAYLFAVLAFGSALLKTISQQRHYHYARRIGMRLRSELTIALFEKALERREAPGVEEGHDEDKASASVGKVISMISEDVNRVLRMGCDSHLLYGSPLELVLGLSFLYNLMGWSAFAGFSVMLLSVPLNYTLGKIAVRTARSRQLAGDKRQTALQELIGDIRAVKLFGWSAAWVRRVEAKRQIELRWLAIDFATRYAYTILWITISLLVPLVSFWTYVKVQGEELTVAVAFTALSLFVLVRGALIQIPGFGIRILQLKVSISRMEAFFAEPEIAEHASEQQRRHAQNLRLVDATLRYPGAPTGTKVLEHMSIDFPAGELTVISGPTGSGKSSLLLGLLGELELVDGAVELPPSVSYAAQHPWLESLTIRDSILFGYPLDELRLRAVLHACALERDLETFPDGQNTFVGERGIALSGGQKARLALARAVYAPTSHILLDDVFAAVDAHTARHLLENLFSSSLLRGRTCVLVTHHADLVRPLAGWEVFLQTGKVQRQGRVEKVEPQEAAQEVAKQAERLDGDARVNANGKDGEARAGPATVTAAAVEGWTSGAVKGEMYRTYLSTGGYLLWTLALFTITTRPVLLFAEQFWLRRWGEAAESQEPVDSSYYLIGYAVIGGITTLMTLLTAVPVSLASLFASRALFHQLLVRFVAAPLRWFDVVPVGTIQNRFTNDISIVDDGLANNLTEFVTNMAALVAALVVTSAVLPAALVSSVVFAVTYASIFRSYLLVNRDVNRIAATTASPLFSSKLAVGFGEALRGITTIRAFGKQREYRARLCRIVDETLSFWYLSATLDIWLSIRTQFLSAFCLLTTATFATYYRISPGLAGIAITSSQMVLQALDTLCSAYGRLVLSMNSLERISEYLHVPQEPQGGIVPPANWPTARVAGPLLEVRDLVLRYAPELPPVLLGVSFHVQAGERIGIVGRTGSGKSTLATSLLRFVEPDSGTIIIDGLDFRTVSLESLRQRITLVPQEATLFEGSLRENLDPFDERDDSDLYEALRRSHLLDPIDTGGAAVNAVEQPSPRDLTLDTRVAPGGLNWSAGQRQLIAVARALLRDSRIVILDESSASLDHALDAKMQQVIREEFQGAAVLTIAHRLRTVVDYDRVLVLDAGRIVELGTPAALLAKEGGVFRRMWEQSGGGKEISEVR